MSCAVLFSVTRLIGLSMQTLKKPKWTEFSWQTSIDNAKFSVETRLEHGVAIEYTYFQWLLLFAHYCHYYSLWSVLSFMY